jgi:hypothetical protein
MIERAWTRNVNMLTALSKLQGADTGPELCVRAAGEQASVVAVMGSMHQTCRRDAAMPCGAVCWFDHSVYLRISEIMIWYDTDVSCTTMYRKSE